MTTTESRERLGVDEAAARVTAAAARLASPVAAAVTDEAVAAFVEAHYPRLIRLARIVCRDGTDAADAVQRGLERAWRQRASLRHPELLRPWIDRIVVREAIRIGRARQSLIGRLFTPSTHVAWIEPAAPHDDAATTWSAFETAFERLPADQRAVIALHLYAGYSVAETADLVGAPVETVRSRLRLGKDRLRRDLQEPDA
jgi:RNA polymerase sigma-70 factor (ECF subfamily)